MKLDKTKFELVRDFHNKFGGQYDGPPRYFDRDEQQFRIKCLREELLEYEEAVEDEDLEEQFDALIDLVYFALGTAHRHGFDFNAGFDIVNQANMLKSLDSSKQRRDFHLEVTKPDGWKSPNLSMLVDAATAPYLQPDQFKGMYRGLITIDGPDGTGKTTLAKRIAKVTGGNYVHLEWTPRIEEVMNNYRMGAIGYAGALAHDRVVVLERPYLSHPIYSIVFRDSQMEDYTLWQKMLESIGHTEIIALPVDRPLWLSQFSALAEQRAELYDDADQMNKVYNLFGSAYMPEVFKEVYTTFGQLTSNATALRYDMFAFNTPELIDDYIERLVLPQLEKI